MTDLFLNLAGRFLIGLTLLLIPLLGVYVSRLIWRVPSLAFFDRIPLLSQLSTTFGILLGFGVFITSETRPAFGINTIVQAGGPWDLPWRVYLSTIGDPALYGYAPLWAQLSADDMPLRWIVYGALSCGAGNCKFHVGVADAPGSGSDHRPYRHLLRGSDRTNGDRLYHHAHPLHPEHPEFLVRSAGTGCSAILPICWPEGPTIDQDSPDIDFAGIRGDDLAPVFQAVQYMRFNLVYSTTYRKQC